MALMIPTCHLNGTTRGALENQLDAAHNAINAAINKLIDASPNGRDYYHQGPDAYAKARAEHESRLARLVSVRDEVMEIWSNLVNG